VFVDDEPTLLLPRVLDPLPDAEVPAPRNTSRPAAADRRR
jgi:hypothetical protein